jgi:multiple sugar transport system substrate-binding protein
MHNYFREALIRQAGGQPLSDDRKTVQWDTDAGRLAFKFFTDLVVTHKVGEIGFMTNDITAFKTGKAGMTIDGSFRLGALAKDAPDLNFGTAPLPAGPAGRATMSSYWANGITKNATGKKLDASVTFLKFLTSPEVMERWTPAVGELPARPESAKKFENDAKLAGFVQGLPHAYATFFADESVDRQAVLDAVDMVVLKGTSPDAAINEAAEKVQQLFDDYWAKQK